MIWGHFWYNVWLTIVYRWKLQSIRLEMYDFAYSGCMLLATWVTELTDYNL